MINDYFDYKSGNDEVNREFVRPFSGGSRMIQLGLLTPLEVLFGALLFYALGVAIGLYLTWALGPIVLLLGVIGMVSGFFYKGPPFNWAGKGLGGVLVGVNFGMLITLGAYFVQTQVLTVEPIVASVPVSLLIAAVIYINEFPDYVADRAVGKDTLVVRLGRGRAVYGFIVMMLGAYVSLAARALYTIRYSRGFAHKKPSVFSSWAACQYYSSLDETLVNVWKGVWDALAHNENRRLL